MTSFTTIAWILMGQLGAAGSPAVPLFTDAPVARRNVDVRLLAANEARVANNSSRAVVGTREVFPSPSAAAVSATPATAPPTNGPETDAGQQVPEWMKSEDTETALAQPINLGGLALRMFLATIGVLIAAGTSIYLGRQWLEKRQPPELSGNQIRVVETRALTPRASVKLIDAAGQMVLVAMDSRGIQGLVPLTSTFDDVWEETENDAPQPAIAEASDPAAEVRRPLRPLATR